MYNRTLLWVIALLIHLHFGDGPPDEPVYSCRILHVPSALMTQEP